jgi:ElaA protein
MDWHDRAFGELAVGELYAIMELRERVFVVEQRCIYLDADGHDPASRHIFATRAGGGAPVAYLRVVPAGTRYAEVSIGRVVIAPEARGTGLGRELMQRGLASVHAHHGDVAIRLGAQAYLIQFYSDLGYAQLGEPFDEDGIPHVYMLRAPGSHA